MREVGLDQASPAASPSAQAGTHPAPADPTHGRAGPGFTTLETLRTRSQPWESFRGREQERSSTSLLLQPHELWQRTEERGEEPALPSRGGLSVHVQGSARSPPPRCRGLGGWRLMSTSPPAEPSSPGRPLSPVGLGKALSWLPGLQHSPESSAPPTPAPQGRQHPQGRGHPPHRLADVALAPASEAGTKPLHDPALDPARPYPSRRQACEGRTRAGKKPREFTVGLRRTKGHPVGKQTAERECG